MEPTIVQELRPNPKNGRSSPVDLLARPMTWGQQ
jgi:hypothetical protein